MSQSSEIEKSEKNAFVIRKPNSAKPRSLFEFGCYQKRLAVVIFLSSVPNPLSGLQFLSTHYTPPFYCGDGVINQSLAILNETAPIRKYSSLDLGLNNSEALIPIGNTSCTSFSSESWKNSTNAKTKSCSNIVFEGPYTSVVTEFGLVCEKAWLKPTMVMLFMFGKMVGIQVAGLFSDRFGRRKIFLIATFSQYIAAFILSIVNNLPFYGVAIFLSGFTAVSNYYTANLLGIEATVSKHRKTMYFALKSGYGVGYMIFPLVSYLIPNWRWFLRATACVGVLSIPFYWLIDESPLWLLNNGTPKQSKALLNKIARMNGLSATAEIEMLVSKEREKKKKSIRTSLREIKQTCKAPLLIWAMISTAYSWILITMIWYVLALNNDNLSGNRFWNVFYGGLVEFGASCLFFTGSNFLGGRNCHMVLTVLIAICLSSIPFVALWSSTAVLVFTMISKLFNSVCFALISVYIGELFPTNTRQSTSGMINAVSKFGSVISPFVIFAGENGNITTPFLGIGAASFVSAMLYCFLPDTKHQKLPNTVKEATSLKYGFLSHFQKKRKGSAFL